AVIYPTHRSGGMAMARVCDALVEHLYEGDQNRIVALYPWRLSADLLSLGGRIAAAEAKGELGRMQLSPELLARRAAFIKEREEAPARLQEFLRLLDRNLRGKRVAMLGHWGGHLDLATIGMREGKEGLFAADSFIMSGGGSKGRTLPAGYQEVVARFYGVPQIRGGYGMTEVIAAMRACPQDKYHLQAWTIPYVLDPKTGQQAPRSGTHTGRLGLIDLLTQTYWGGFLTGDEVTLSWGDQEPCPCGRSGPYLHPGIRRYSEIEGGDDKITCAGAPEAHDKALDFALRELNG
ncbi:MAG: hypothetical protein ABW034_21270, partial [Steroidobacteraceae bacterium]